MVKFKLAFVHSIVSNNLRFPSFRPFSAAFPGQASFLALAGLL